MEEMISREKVLKILEETKDWLLKAGALNEFGPLVCALDRVKRLPIESNPERCPFCGARLEEKK